MPAQSANSLRAASVVIAFLYDRTAVIVSKQSATATIRPPSEISSPERPAGYPVPSNFSWCSGMVRAQGPSHSARGAASRAPSAGCCLITANSCSSSLPGLLSTAAGTDSFPMSCRRADHLSLSLSACGTFNSSAITSVSARTRSE